MLENLKDSDIIKFAEKADVDYIKAWETRSISILKDCFTRSCCTMLSSWMIAEGEFRYFAGAKHRKNTWSINRSNLPNNIVLTKSCVYKDIRISLFKTMKVSEDYVEEWTLIEEDKLRVKNIRML